MARSLESQKQIPVSCLPLSTLVTLTCHLISLRLNLASFCIRWRKEVDRARVVVHRGHVTPLLKWPQHSGAQTQTCTALTSG